MRMRWFASCRLLTETRKAFSYHQTFNLVHVKLERVKDKSVDEVVASERGLKAVCTLVSIVSSASNASLPIYHLSRHHGQLGLPLDLNLSTFIRRYPMIFSESYVVDSGRTRVPCFGCTVEAIDVPQDGVDVLEQCRLDTLDRLCKLLMLTKDRMLPLQMIEQLRWDMGLPYDYCDLLIPCCPDLFSLVHLPDDRVGLKLVQWNDCLAVSRWNEVLHLTIHKKTKCKNVSNLCRLLSLPHKFTKVFEHYPGIFYISMKCDTQTVILWEGYERSSTTLAKTPSC